MAETKDGKDILDEICPRIHAQADMVNDLAVANQNSDNVSVLLNLSKQP